MMVRLCDVDRVPPKANSGPKRGVSHMETPRMRSTRKVIAEFYALGEPYKMVDFDKVDETMTMGQFESHVGSLKNEIRRQGLDREIWAGIRQGECYIWRVSDVLPGYTPKPQRRVNHETATPHGD